MEAGQKRIKLQLSGKLVYLVIQSILPFFASLRKTKNPDFVWKSGFYCFLLFFKVVPPGIEPFASVYSNSLSDCTFFALSFMKTIELALR